MTRELTRSVDYGSDSLEQPGQIPRALRALAKLQQVEHLPVYVAALMIACAGLAVRITLLLLSGNREVSPLSGVGDQIRYLTLADSIFQGNGFTYAGQSTALRPPLYPLLLAGFHIVFGSYYLLAMRIFQSLIGIALAIVCALLASKFFGKAAGAMAGAIALALPTLVFVNTELQTENLAAFLTTLFLFFLLADVQNAKKGVDLVGLVGLASGFSILLRFNSAILPVIGAIIYVWCARNFRRALILCLLTGFIVAPWLLRNAQAFHGKVLFSSHGGINLLQGVLTPDGRAQKGEDEKFRSLVGWLHTDIEQNTSHRFLFPSEDRLDRQARLAAINAWKNLDWPSRLRLLKAKIVTFWLSTDQLLETSSFSATQRMLRGTGVASYWLILALALIGWWSLFLSSPRTAKAIAFYAAFVTLAHLPFVMNTRLRIPFIDPFLPVLAGGGIWHLFQLYREHRVPASVTCAPELIGEPAAAGSDRSA